MKHATLLLICIILFTPTAHAQGIQFIDEHNRVSASIPEGWEQAQRNRRETVIKLVRSDQAGRKAVIALLLDDIPAGREVPGYDIWNLSDDEIRKEAVDGSMLGETVTVMDVGRASIDGVHVIWSKTHRQIPDTQLWECVYEGVWGSKYITVRLTSFGSKDWFISNQPTFADFVRDIRFHTKQQFFYKADWCVA